MPNPLEATAAGYVFVIQDTRGRFASDGDFVPFIHEAADGYDSVEWAAGQPWSNGEVGMIGGSYVGYTQWMAASMQPPHLRAIAPVVATSDLYDGWVREGGAASLWFNVSWLLGSLGPDIVAKRAPGDTARADRLTTRSTTWPTICRPFRAPSTRPWTMPASATSTERGWPTRIATRTGAGSRRARPTRGSGCPPSTSPAGTTSSSAARSRTTLGMHANGATASARDGQRLVVGPWRHAAPMLADPAGDVVFGLDSTGSGIDLPALQLRFFDRWLKGTPPDAADGPTRPPVRHGRGPLA